MRAGVVCERLHLRASKAATADADVANRHHSPPSPACTELCQSLRAAAPPHQPVWAKPTRFARVGAVFRAEAFFKAIGRKP
ncbi:MAG: hypothetical protein EBQ71_06605 [Betaproteobacteria bacterium]|nr:hypothetical protein [Betaproteobacteria bacterium]